MNIRDRLEAALATASPDLRPELAARLLANELRRAALTGHLCARTRQRVNYHLNRAAEELSVAVSRAALAAGDIVVVQDRGEQVIGEVAELDASHVWLALDARPWPRAAVIRNLTLNPAPSAEAAP